MVRVLRMALQANRGLDATQRRFLDTFARITNHALPGGDPPTIEAADLTIDGAHQRKHLVQLSALAVLLSRPVCADALDFLKALAKQLATPNPVIDAIDAVHQGRHLCGWNEQFAAGRP